MKLISTPGLRFSPPSQPQPATPPTSASSALPRPDSWQLNETSRDWVSARDIDPVHYRRTTANFGAAVGALASHFATVGLGIALGVSAGSSLGSMVGGAIGWAALAGGILGGGAGAFYGGKFQAATLWGRSGLTKLGTAAGNVLGRVGHFLRVPLRQDHLETAERFNIHSVNRFGADMKHSGHEKISEAEANNLIAKLQPGDIILTGDNRSTPIATATHLITRRSSFTHALIYKGNDRAIEAIMGPGVVESSMKDILTGKHHAIALRPDYEPGQAQEAIQFSEGLLGKKYDYKFKNDNGNWYCSEAVVAALAEAAPQVEFDTRSVFGKALVLPNDLFFSEDVGVVGEVGLGRSYMDRMMGKFIDPPQP